MNCRIDELIYYLMIMLPTVCKGFGLDMSDSIYLIVAAFSSLLFVAKFFSTNWKSYKEVIFSIILIGLAGIITVTSHKFSIMMAAFVIIGAKNVNITKCLKLLSITWIICFLLNITMSAVGIKSIDPQLVYHKEGSEIAYGLGYGHKNQLSIACVITYLSYSYLRFEKMKFWEFISLTLIMFTILNFSKSRLGLIMLLFTSIMYFLIRNKNILLEKILQIIYKIILPVSVIFSFVTSVFYGRSEIIDKINVLLNNRIWMGNLYLNKYPFSLFGSNVILAPGSFLDNGYISIYCRFGMILFLLFIIGYQIVINKLITHRKHKELLLVSTFLLMGIIEEFFVNPFMNITMIMIAISLYNVNIIEDTNYKILSRQNLIEDLFEEGNI